MKKTHTIILIGLGISLALVALLAPFASREPDGLDRVAQDLKFSHKASESTVVQNMPFAKVFNEYAVNGIENEKLATALAGITGALVVFGLAWGLGKLTIRKP